MSSRHRFAAVAVAFVAMAGVSVAAAGSVGGPARVDFRAWRVDPPDYIADPDQRVQRELVDLVNQARADGGMPPVAWHSQVSAAAMVHAEYLASIRRLDHLGPGGTNTGDRLDQAGFGWISWGENLGAGFSDPAVLVETWLNSPGHRDQLLREYQYAGVGFASTPDGVPYWVLITAT